MARVHSRVSQTTAAPARSLPLAQTSLRTLPTLESAGAFSYACNRCKRCCSDKRIRVNPYETYRLARALGLGTTELADTLASLSASPASADDDLTTAWLDVDAVLARDGAPQPANAEEAMVLHRAVLLKWARTLTNQMEER